VAALSRRDTRKASYHYEISGLDNIYLADVTLSTCTKCRASFTTIPRVENGKAKLGVAPDRLARAISMAALNHSAVRRILLGHEEHYWVARNGRLLFELEKKKTNGEQQPETLVTTLDALDIHRPTKRASSSCSGPGDRAGESPHSCPSLG